MSDRNIRIEQILADSHGDADALALKVYLLEQQLARLRETPPEPEKTALLKAADEIALRPKQTNSDVVVILASQWRHLREALTAWNAKVGNGGVSP